MRLARTVSAFCLGSREQCMRRIRRAARLYTDYANSLTSSLCDLTAVDLVIKALRKLPWLNEAEVRHLPHSDSTRSALPNI